MQYASGDSFEGEWTNDMKNGPGTYYYATGAVYEGVWQADVAKCGSYRQDANVRPNAPGALPSLQLQDADKVLDEAQQDLPPIV